MGGESRDESREAKRRREGSQDSDSGSGLREELVKLKDEVANMRALVEKLVANTANMDKRFEEMEKKLDRQRDETVALREEIERNAREREKMEETAKKNEVMIEQLRDRLIEQEARSRRNNLVFHGIDEASDEDCVERLRKVLKIGKDIKIERAHRLGRRRAGNQKPRPIIAKFLDYNDRQRVWNDRKTRQNIFTAEDFPAEIREARRMLSPDVKAARDAGKQAWVVYPARLLVDGRCVKEIRPSSCPIAYPQHSSQP